MPAILAQRDVFHGNEIPLRTAYRQQAVGLNRAARTLDPAGDPPILLVARIGHDGGRRGKAAMDLLHPIEEAKNNSQRPNPSHPSVHSLRIVLSTPQASNCGFVAGG